MAIHRELQDDWVPSSCTLPTVEQPLRRAEFDQLFAADVVSVDQISPQEVRFELRPEPEVAGRAGNLAAKETGCCSFFAFDLTITDGKVRMAVSTEAPHEPVLAALTARANRLIGSAT
jgi:hypothetical protein